MQHAYCQWYSTGEYRFYVRDIRGGDHWFRTATEARSVFPDAFWGL